MSITTYAELKSAIADFLNRDDLTSVIPTFISLAEAGMKRSMRNWRMENRATATLDSQYEALPARFIAPIRLSITSGTTYELSAISQADIADMREKSNNVTGRPRYYALTQGELEFYPTPDGQYTLEMVYYEAPEALSDTVSSNWVLANFPDLYLYGSLLHSAPYLSDDGRTQIWSSLYQSALEAVLIDEQKAKYGGSGLRMKLRSF